MKLKVFSVFDSKLAVYDQPFFMLTEAAAIRSFSDAVNDGSGQNQVTARWNRHPEDYSLFLIGEFDDGSGDLAAENPRSLVTASALVQEPLRTMTAAERERWSDPKAIKASHERDAQLNLFEKKAPK